ncbi:MAG: recombinase family protein, partial [Synechococcales bacterium]|nr:recombinase family protein [Synechococcales bacterium]
TDHLTSLRSLMETAQHYWTLEARLRQMGDPEINPSSPVQRFIQLLRDGTVTADPYPVRPIGLAANAITLATPFQYRSSRCCHAWQFWLDAGSPNWQTGGETLFAAPLFLQEVLARRLQNANTPVWTIDDTQQMNEQRLQRQVLDLMGRTRNRIILCHSDLSNQGQEQLGSLLPLVNAAIPAQI